LAYTPVVFWPTETPSTSSYDMVELKDVPVFNLFDNEDIYLFMFVL
jgi:hypothetical protein